MAFTNGQSRARRTRFRRTVLVTVGAVLGLTACGNAPAPDSASTSKVVIASPSYSAGSWDAYIAADRGFLKANGLQAEFISTPGPSATMAALGTGAAQTGSGLVGAGFGAILQGLPVRLIAMEDVRTVVSLIGAKGVTGPGQIKGKKLATTSATDQQSAAAVRWLQSQGVATGDYERVFIPSSAQRLSALESSAVGAAVLVPPADFEAVSKGFTQLQVINEPGFVGGHFANARWAATPQAVRYLKSIIQAIRFLYDPANRTAAIETLRNYSHLSEAAASSAYQQFVVGRVYPEDASTSVADVRAALADADTSGTAPGAKARAVNDVADLTALEQAKPR
jgi:ABC-type nitrate/sulfonate/bicarbonate transport system substrate-binding protein